MTGTQTLTDRLRDRIVSGVHLGHIRAGDRLPSIRQVAEDTGEDARAVARAYRALKAEGLVEVRERSGVYAASHPHVGGAVLEETAQWAAHVLADAWKRGIPVHRLPEFLHRCTGTRKVRCAFVEASEDVITAFTHDLRERLGLDAQPVWLDSLPRASHGKGWKKDSMPPALRDADLVVTTAFHAREVGQLADALGKPVIAATINPNLVAAVERQLRSGSLTVVCADRHFGHRIQVQYQPLITADTRIRVIHVNDADNLAMLDRTEPVLLTRAARQRLGSVDLRLVFPHSPTISSNSALEIAEFLIRFNLEAQAARPSARK